MAEGSWFSIIAMGGWLILVVSAFRARQVSAGKTVVMALVWGVIFLTAVIVIKAIRP